MTKRLLLLGCGNMAKALISKQWNEQLSIDVYSPSGVSSNNFVQEYAGKVIDSLDASVSYDYVFFAFKPQQLTTVAESLSDFDLHSTDCISILASIDCKTIQSKFGMNNILRIMPNTPAKIGAGTLTYYVAGERSIWDDILTLFSNNSVTIECGKEREIDLSTPITGSGPAFIFELARIWEKFLHNQGFDKQTASSMVHNTFLGSAKLMLDSPDGVEQLKKQVTSKAGVTERGLDSLVGSEFEKTVIQSLNECLNRIEELKK